MAPPPPPPPLPVTPAALHALQFLSTALSERGPSSLPYADETKHLIRHHLISLVESHPSLHPITSFFTHNNGRTVNLLQADGTIPIVFNNVVYNIPVSIWLLESYPFSPPSVFLNPTPEMIVKPDHPHVDRSGFVLLPYLRNWIYPSSNLVDLARSLSQIFSHDPPLFSRQNPNPNPNPVPASLADSSPLSHLSSRIFSSLAPYAPRLHGRPAEDAINPNPVSASLADSSPLSHLSSRILSSLAPYAPRLHGRPAEEDANVINKIVEAVQADIAGIRRAREGEIEGLFAAQARLRCREEELVIGIREMSEEKEGLEQQLQLVLMNTDLLEEWVGRNEGKWACEVDADDAFRPADGLSRQLLDCAAADLAVEDTIYGIDKAMQEGSIPSEMYLKNVRGLAREQFFHRAMETKVRAAQVQAQVTSMAARASHYGS